MKLPIALLCVILVSIQHPLRADDLDLAATLPDGIYVQAAPGGKAPVPGVAPADESEPAFHGRCVTTSLGKPRMISTSNDNDRFILYLDDVGPAEWDRENTSVLLVVGGNVFRVHTMFTAGQPNHTRLSTRLDNRQLAHSIAERLSIEPTLRKHPGHSLHVEWLPRQTAFDTEDNVWLTMKITNVGKVPVAIHVGGKQRGYRDNQFRFIARSSRGRGDAIPDTGSAIHFGGIGVVQTLNPGECLSKNVDITRWFKFEMPGQYQITGIFELEMRNPEDKWSHPAIWDDLIAGECTVRIVAPEKQAAE